MQGGYYMLELSGLDLTKSVAQTISGSYAGAKTALESGKPVWIYGVDGYGPIPATASAGASNAVVLSFLTYTASVATTSAVTVTALVVIE